MSIEEKNPWRSGVRRREVEFMEFLPNSFYMHEFLHLNMLLVFIYCEFDVERDFGR